jgi:hypothetical protein
MHSQFVHFPSTRPSYTVLTCQGGDDVMSACVCGGGGEWKNGYSDIKINISYHFDFSVGTLENNSPQVQWVEGDEDHPLLRAS